jgi:hypothetical protein
VSVKTHIQARPRASIKRNTKFFEGVIINNCGSKSEYVGSSRARCVYVPPPLFFFLLLLAGSKKAL